MSRETEQANLELMDFKIGNHVLSLYTSPELFRPNETTKLFAEAARIYQGDVVFDIGSGVGPLAIYAALEPSSSVHAVEIVEEQYHLLRKNIERNNVGNKVTAYHGSFFDPIPQEIKADVILADCSGIAEKPARVSGWYPPRIPTGGEDGTENVIYVLAQGGQHLAERGRLYIPIAVGLSHREKILEVARSRFRSLEKKVEREFPLPPKEKDVILQNMQPVFSKDLRQRGSRILWRAEIYEATQPTQ